MKKLQMIALSKRRPLVLIRLDSFSGYPHPCKEQGQCGQVKSNIVSGRLGCLRYPRQAATYLFKGRSTCQSSIQSSSPVPLPLVNPQWRCDWPCSFEAKSFPWTRCRSIGASISARPSQAEPSAHRFRTISWMWRGWTSRSMRRSLCNGRGDRSKRSKAAATCRFFAVERASTSKRIEGIGQAPRPWRRFGPGFEAKPLSELLVELDQADPVLFRKIDRENRRRVVRAVEVVRLTGRPYSEQRAEWSDARQTGLTCDAVPPELTSFFFGLQPRPRI